MFNNLAILNIDCVRLIPLNHFTGYINKEDSFTGHIDIIIFGETNASIWIFVFTQEKLINVSYNKKKNR